MIKINDELLGPLIQEAKKSIRLRKNYNFHEKMDDPVQRLLNALEPDTYVRPHRHLAPDKDEMFLILKGRMVFIEFDAEGHIRDHLILDPLEGNFGCEVKAGKWHCLISLESGSVAYEVKEGPFSPIKESDFAPWSPANDSDEIEQYQNHLLKELGLVYGGSFNH